MNDPMNGHTFDDSPDEFIGRIDALMEAADGTFCEYRCKGKPELLPMLGTRWGVGFTHHPDCELSDPPLRPPRYNDGTTE